MAEQVRLYAATKDGVCVVRSTRTGWESAGLVLPGAVSEGFAGARRQPERVYVAVEHDGLYATDDAGAHWSRLFEGDARTVALDPVDEDVIYVGTEPVHLFRSEDRGDRSRHTKGTWRTSSSTRTTRTRSTSASSTAGWSAASTGGRPGRT